ncbi:hypothetical protein [Plantibacter sp. YIM 135347]|uniref:hypothetical protein n=1 Tax=Plantibacter sp. YIM 135347 TaxID=3423919 RepID=UPI003D326896
MAEPQHNDDESNTPLDEEQSTIKPLPPERRRGQRRSMVIALVLLAAGTVATHIVQIISRIVDR